MLQQSAFSVADPSQIGTVRRAALRLAQAHHLSESAAGAVAIVASELATNLSRYATSGHVYLRTVAIDDGTPTAIEVLSVDAGPGLDPQQALRDGYSTGGTSGNGLGAVRRLASEFDLHSAPGSGTVVLARLGEARQPRTRFSWGLVHTPAPYETVSGDACRVAPLADGVAVLVVDGLGHGEHAHVAAEAVAATFDGDPSMPPRQACERAHRAAQGTRGAAMAVARISGATLRYAGVGNIAGSIIADGQSRGLPSQNGTVGAQVRRIQEFEYNWGAESLLVLHSDGLSNRWSLDAYPGLATRHPSIIAAVLHRDFSRGRDDATVVVVRDRGAERAHG